MLLFGAIGGGNDPRKGFDLLLQALAHLRGEMSDLNLVVFGQLAPRNPPELGFPIHYTGYLHDALSLRALYSSADTMVIPSRTDNLPNTGIEALACGTPVVAFNVCGLPDIVQHQKTGFLAKAFDTKDLAQGIQWVMSDEERLAGLRVRARQAAEKQFNSTLVTAKYQMVYEDAMRRKGG